MKTLLLAATLAAIAFPAAAQAPRDLGQVTITRGTAPNTIELPARYSRMWSGEFDNLQGGYDLSNGETMDMTRKFNRKYIKIGDRPRVEVVAVGDYDFVSLDQNYRVVLSEPDRGEVTGYVLMRVRPASGSLSQTEPEVQSVRFAVR